MSDKDLKRKKKTIGRPPLSDKPKGETRKQLLDAAALAFAKHGYAGTSVSQIARDAGLTSSAVYRHFDGKPDILLNLIGDRGPHVSIAKEIQEADTPNPIDFAKLVSSYTNEGFEPTRRLMLEIHQAAFRETKAANTLKEVQDSFRTEVAEGLERCRQAGGNIAENQDGYFAADVLFILILGLSNLQTINPKMIGDAKFKSWLEARILEMLARKDLAD